VLGVVGVASAALKLAVTPVGSPEMAREISLLLSPVGFTTLILLVAGVPECRLKVLAEVKRLKLGVGMLRVTVVELFVLPEVPITVTVWFPGVADALGVKVNVLLEVVVAGLNDAVTPAGNPLAVSATLPLNPLAPATPMVVLRLLPPTTRSSAPSDEVRLKLGAAIVSATVVELLVLPEVPVTVTVWVPEAADAPGVNVNVLFEVVLAGLNDAVTPSGSPLAVSATLPLNPPSSVTVIVVLAFFPPATSARDPVDEDRLKLGLVTVNTSAAELFTDPEVPVTVMA